MAQPLTATLAASGGAEALEALASAFRGALRLGAAGGGMLAIVGLLALTIATRHRRVLAIVGGGALGALAAAGAAGTLKAHLGLPHLAAVVSGGIGGAAACALVPRVFPFAAGAVPGALLGAAVPLEGRTALGAAAGGLLGGLVALLFAREIAAAFASFAGGLLLGAGLLAALAAHPIARELAGRPFALLAFAVVTGVAGTAFQASRGDAASAEPAHGPDPRS